jgi:hypothetical protein
MDMDSAWEKIKKSVKEGAALSIEKIEEYSKVGKLKVEEFAAKRKVERNFMEIGERVFELITADKKADPASDVSVKKAISNVKALRDELAAIDKKIKATIENGKKPRRTKQDEGAGV